MALHIKPRTIREAVGIFVDAQTLQRAIGELRDTGFENAELGLVAGDFSVRQRLGQLFSETNKDAGDPQAPCTAFVAKDSVGDTPRALLGGALAVSVVAAGGAVVASAGVLGGAVALAAAGGVAVGGMGAVLAGIIGQSDAEFLEEQVGEGHLLLFVRTRDADRERRAKAILDKHAAHEARIYSVPEADAA